MAVAVAVYDNDDGCQITNHWYMYLIFLKVQRFFEVVALKQEKSKQK